MRIFLILALAALFLFTFIMLFRAIKCKTVFDRMNAISVINAYVILIIIVIGFLDGRPEMYVDIAIAYGFLGFVGNIIVAKYLFKDWKKGDGKDKEVRS